MTFSAEALLLLPCLELLDLSNNKLLVRTLENIGSSLSSTPQLKTLKMSRCGLNQESLTILGTTLNVHKKVYNRRGPSTKITHINLYVYLHVRELKKNKVENPNII